MISLDIKTNAELSAFQKLDAAEQQTVLQAMKLQTQLKQAEAAQAAWANAAAQANAKVQSAVQQTARVQQRLDDQYAQRINLRHGAGTALTQAQRQELRTFREATAGQTVYSAPASVMAAQMTANQRQALATRLRQTRQQQQHQAALDTAMAQRVEMESLSTQNNRDIDDRVFEVMKTRRLRIAKRNKLLAEKEKQEQEAWDRDVAMVSPYVLGRGAIDMAGRGVGPEDDSVFMRRARRRVARRISNTPELNGRVSAEDFDAMSRAMADRMERNNQRRETAAGYGIMGIMAAIGGVSAITQQGNQLRGDALARMTDAAGSRRELKQIADSGADYRRMIGLAAGLGTGVGMSGEDAFKTVFAGKSAGLLDGDFAGAILSARRMNLDPTVALQAIQKVKGNWANAGSTSEILGKLLIAAGPSPANVTELAAGVGTIASPLNALGGSADEALAALGVLSGPNKNVEGTAERIKSVADQLNKKRSRIQFAGAPLQGLDLIQALPQLAAAGRLRGEDGKAASVEDFLGEMQATNAMRDLIQNRDAIAAQVKQMRASGVGSYAADQAAAYDPTTTAMDVAERNKKRREFAEEQRFGPDEAAANAVDEAHRAWLVQTGAGSAKLTWNTALNWVSRSSPVGVDARTHAMAELFHGNVHDDETRRVVFDSLVRGRSADDLTKYRDAIKNGKGLIYDRPLLGGVEDQLMAFNRGMTGDESRVALEAVEGRLKQIQEDNGDGRWQRAWLGQTTLKDRWMNFKEGAASRIGSAAGSVADPFNAAVDAFAQSSGLSPNDYRVQIYRKIATKRAGQAAGGAVAGLLGGDSAGIAAGVQGKLSGLSGEADQAIYEANLRIIADAQTQADADLKGATKGTAAYDRASARSKGLKGLVRGAKASGNRIDVFEAQSIVDQISGANGDEAFKQNIVALFNRVVTGIDKLVAGQPGATNTTPQDKKNALNAPPKPKGTRVVN